MRRPGSGGCDGMSGRSPRGPGIAHPYQIQHQALAAGGGLPSGSSVLSPDALGALVGQDLGPVAFSPTLGGVMPKDRMIAALGEDHLLLPGLVAGALVANDRVKYLLTLLQTARAVVDGAGGTTSLRDERLACGMVDAGLDRVVGESVREPDGRYRIPGAEMLAHQAVDEVQRMLAPLNTAGSPGAQDLSQRVAAVSAALSLEGDLIGSEDIARLSAGRRGGGDSLHLVVMDAHRALNELEARIATESIDGASVHDLASGDRELVRAFMRG